MTQIDQGLVDFVAKSDEWANRNMQEMPQKLFSYFQGAGNNRVLGYLWLCGRDRT